MSRDTRICISKALKVISHVSLLYAMSSAETVKGSVIGILHAAVHIMQIASMTYEYMQEFFV